MWEQLKTSDKSEVFWKISTRGFYGNFMDGFCFKVILFYLMKIWKRVVTLVSQKNAEDFTSNNFLKCAQVKKLKFVTLFSYERKKNR